MKADKAGQFKVSTTQHGVKKGAQFSENSIVITSGMWYRLNNSLEKFLIFVLSRLKLNDLAIASVGTKTRKFVNNSDRLSSYFDLWRFIADEETKKPHRLQVTMF